jgi:2-methylisocitrate lyase-like PEP mutase family enzyme
MMERLEALAGRKDSRTEGVFPLIGVYDVFSATIAANHFDGIFLSGFGFAASFYGLPDIGFLPWPEVVAFAQRVRTVLPDRYLLVDIDDGYADVNVACHVVSLLESLGASGVVLEDQKRPRRCGHFNGKQILDLEEYLVKLKKVLETRRALDVVARTDASDIGEIRKRAMAFAEAGADAILIDGAMDLSLFRELRSKIDQPLVFNQIAGGKSPSHSFRELKDAGISVALYSTPCLFAAQSAMDDAVKSLLQRCGHLPEGGKNTVGIHECTAILDKNLTRRDARNARAFNFR